MTLRLIVLFKYQEYKFKEQSILLSSVFHWFFEIKIVSLSFYINLYRIFELSTTW